MKKSVLWICMLLALAMLLVSCQGMKDALRPAPKTAEELWARIGEVMQEYDSYEVAMEMDIVMVMEGYAVESTATGMLIEDKGEDYYYYSETNVTVTCDALDLNQETRAISAYMDGKAFEFRGENGYERKLYSKMTAEEYAAYLVADREASSFDTDITDCTQAEFAQNEDKTWTLTYSGYTKKAIKGITGALSTQEMDVFGADIVDVKVTFHADKSFCVTEIIMEFEFDTAEGAKQAPALNVRMKLTAVGDEVERVTDTIDPAKYKEVDDLAIRKEIDKMIEQRNEAKEGKFENKLSQTVKVMGEVQTYSETSMVEYGTEDGKLVYEINGNYGGEESTIIYRNGTQTVYAYGESYDVPQTEQEAREFIQSLINEPGFGYDSAQVTNITKKDEGLWELELTLSDTTEFEALYEALGGAYKSATQTVTVAVQDGKLIRMKNVIDSKGSVMQGSDIYEITWTVQIETSFFD